jgi:tetratricopeptide (TPR) repeat protein
MSTSQEPAGAPGRGRPAPDAVERLYVYWLVSTVLLALVVVIAALLVRGSLRQQAQAVQELEQRLAALEKAPRTESPSALEPRGRTPSTPVEPPPAEVRPPEATPRPVEPTTKPASAERPATAPVVSVPAEAEIAAKLARVMGEAPTTMADVADRVQAAALVTEALTHIGRAEWSGATWARLAVLARLVGQNSAAEAFAKRAAAAGDPLLAYTEVALRTALARGWPQEALPLAERFLETTRGAPLSRVLLAAALLASDEPALADEALDTVGNTAPLGQRDRLLLARLLMALERWERMGAVLAESGGVPEELAAEHNFLQAVVLAQSGRTVEALAIFEYLASRLPPETKAGTAATSAPGSGPSAGAATPGGMTASERPYSDRYEIEVWRGVTLWYAKQLEAARQALEAAARLDPGRPDAHYYLGRLEAAAGRPSVAVEHLKNALASAARMAPAWEALAALEINAGQVDAALQHLTKALEINSRRASAHFLTAIAHAKAGQREPAATALRAALRLEPRLLEEAKQTEVLLRMFAPGELESLAGAPGSVPAAAEPTTAPQAP